ncbi:hypothetical protein EIP86_010857 [Pleurotus ostreatoroseus]|nr:hypothetical protein EIP86_010857 [Pleurotus ostreatoroseus]
MSSQWSPAPTRSQSQSQCTRARTASPPRAAATLGHRSARRHLTGDYAPNTLASDVTRLLDRGYAHRGAETYCAAGAGYGAGYGYGGRGASARPQVCAYVDSEGELHDPDFQLFPAFRPPVRMGLLERRHTVSGQVQVRAAARTRSPGQIFDDYEEEMREENGSDEEEDRAYWRRGRPRMPLQRPQHLQRSHTRAASILSSTSASPSIFSAASYMLDSTSVTSAPTNPGHELGHSDEIEEIARVDSADCDAQNTTTPGIYSKEDDSGSDCSSPSWSFLRRMMCTPSVPSSLGAAPTLEHPATPSEGRKRSGSGSSRSLLSRMLRPRSASASTSATLCGSGSASPSPSPASGSPSSASPTPTAFSPAAPSPRLYAREPDTCSEKSAAQAVMYDYLDGRSHARDVPSGGFDRATDAELSEDGEPSAKPRDAALRRRLRAGQLRVRTAIWRVKKRLVEASRRTPGTASCQPCVRVINV